MVGIALWCCVCLCPKGSLHKHGQLLNGKEVRCWKWQPDQLVDMAAAYFEIHIFTDLYRRFRAIGEKWQQIKKGDVVMCRAKRGDPVSLFRDNPGPMTCGRIVSTGAPEFTAWMKANNSKQYRCPQCDNLYMDCQPLSGMDDLFTLNPKLSHLSFVSMSFSLPSKELFLN